MGSLIKKIMQAFDSTWRVDEGRPFSGRFGRYLSVLLNGTVAFFSAVGLSASVQSSALADAALPIAPLETVIDDLGQLDR